MNMLVSQTLKTRSLAQSYAIETNGAYGPPLRNHPLFLTLWSFQGLRVGLLRLPCFKSIDVYKLLGDIGRCFRGSFYFPCNFWSLCNSYLNFCVLVLPKRLV